MPTPPPDTNEPTHGTSPGTSPGTDAVPTNAAAALDAKLLAILVCPLTRSPLHQDGDWLVAERPEGAGLRYPIRDGIPVLLMDQATLPEGVATLDDFKTKFAAMIPG